MRIQEISEALDAALVDIDEAITITWKGDTPHSDKWRNTLVKKYFNQFGKYVRETSFKAGGKVFWILSFEKCALIGQTIKPGVGSITHYCASSVPAKTGRWVLNHDNSLTSSSGVTAIPIHKNVKSIRQLVEFVKEATPTSSAKVTPEVANSEEKDVSKKHMESLKIGLPKILPPYSNIKYFDNKNTILVEDAMGRGVVAAAFTKSGEGNFDVVLQTAVPKKNVVIDDISDPSGAIISRVLDHVRTADVTSGFKSAIMAKALADDKSIKTFPSENGVMINDSTTNMMIGTMTCKFGLVIRMLSGYEDQDTSAELNKLDMKSIQSMVKKALQPTARVAAVANKFNSEDSNAIFTHINAQLYKVSNRETKKHVGYASILENETLLFDLNRTQVDYVNNSISSIIVQIDKMSK